MKLFVRRLIILIFLTVFVVPNSLALMQEPSEAEKTYEQACVMREAQRYSEALDLFVKALEYADKEKDSELRISILWKMGNIHIQYGDYANGNAYFIRGYEEASQAGNEDMRFQFASNLVVTHSQLNDIATAQKWLEIQNGINISDICKKEFYLLYNTGIVNQAAHQFDKAIDCHLRALNYAESHNMESVYSITQYAEISDIYLSQKQPEKAIYYAAILADSARNVNDLALLRKAYKTMEEAYTIKEDFQMSGKYGRLYAQISDSVFNMQAFNNSKSSLLNYEKAQNDAHINSLNKRIAFQTIITCAVLIIILLLVLYVRNVLKSRKKLRNAYLLLIERYREINRIHNELRKKGQLLSAVDSDENQSQIEDTEATNNDSPPENDTPSDEAKDVNSTKQSSVRLSDSQVQDLWQKISEVMNSASVISDSNFSISKLSSMIGSNTAYVSFVINSVYGKNFKALLHYHRINEVCRRLADTDSYGRLTLQAIYEEMGYRSASNFIKAFKTVMNITPSEYIRLVRSSK